MINIIITILTVLFIAVLIASHFSNQNTMLREIKNLKSEQEKLNGWLYLIKTGLEKK